MSRGVELALPALALPMAGFIVVSTLIMIVRCWSPLPFWDQWANLTTGRTVTWSWLIAQHNEHRLLFPRLIFLLDGWLASETNVVDLAFNVIIQAVSAALLVVLARGAGLRRRAETVWTAGVVLALLFSAVQFDNFTWGFQVQFFGVCLAAVAAFTALGLLRPGPRALCVVVALETVAVYTLSSGMIVPFLAIPLALWLGRPRRHVAVLSAAAVLLLLSYLVGYHTHDPNADPLRALSHLDRVLTHTATQLGGPLYLLVPRGGLAAPAIEGTAGIALFLFAGWRVLRSRRERPPHDAVLLAIAGFAVASTLLTALGRFRFGAGQALSSRYTTPVLFFWLSLLLLGAARVVAGDRRRRVAVMAAGVLIVAVVALGQPRLVENTERLALARSAALPAVLTGVADAEVLARLYPTPGLPLELSAQLKKGRGSAFAQQWAGWLGTPLRDHVELTGTAACPGRFTAAVFVPHAVRAGWRAYGRLDLEGRNRSGKIVLADADGRVVGYAVGGLSAPGAPRGNPNDVWFGAFVVSDPSTVVAYALLGGERTACSLGRAQRIVR